MIEAETNRPVRTIAVRQSRDAGSRASWSIVVSPDGTRASLNVREVSRAIDIA